MLAAAAAAEAAAAEAAAGALRARSLMNFHFTRTVIPNQPLQKAKGVRGDDLDLWLWFHDNADGMPTWVKLAIAALVQPSSAAAERVYVYACSRCCVRDSTSGGMSLDCGGGSHATVQRVAARQGRCGHLPRLPRGSCAVPACRR